MDASEVRMELEGLGKEGFAARYGRFFLVVTDPNQLEEMSLFVNTATRDSSVVVRSQRAERAAYLPIMESRGKETPPRYEVGREPPCHVVLAHHRVSKIHAFFTYNAGMLSLTDIGSKNGTRLNSAPLTAEEEVPVDLGDTIEFGPVATALWGLDDLIAALSAA